VTSQQASRACSHPVGAFFDLIDPRRHHGQKASVEQLMVVAEIGTELFYEAICAGDEDDNEEFFVRACGHWVRWSTPCCRACVGRRARRADGSDAGTATALNHARVMVRATLRRNRRITSWRY
jgi:hypothetical protein